MPKEKPKKRYLPPSVRRAIEYARTQADMNLANCAVPEEHKAAMKNYLDTWVTGPLRQVLEWDDGERDARAISRWGT